MMHLLSIIRELFINISKNKYDDLSSEEMRQFLSDSIAIQCKDSRMFTEDLDKLIINQFDEMKKDGFSISKCCENL